MHCVKSNRTRRFSGPYFSAIKLDQKYFEYGHFTRSFDDVTNQLVIRSFVHESWWIMKAWTWDIIFATLRCNKADYCKFYWCRLSLIYKLHQYTCYINQKTYFLNQKNLKIWIYFAWNAVEMVGVFLMLILLLVRLLQSYWTIFIILK